MSRRKKPWKDERGDAQEADPSFDSPTTSSVPTRARAGDF